MTTVLEWTTSHRYASLGMVTAVCALICIACWNSFSPPVSSLSDDDDELVALDEIDGLETHLGEEMTVKPPPRRIAAQRAEIQPGFDDLVPMFASNAAPDQGIVSAMFEGSSRASEPVPVWLAGTIETDDFPQQEAFLPAIPAPASSITGPVLTPP